MSKLPNEILKEIEKETDKLIERAVSIEPLLTLKLEEIANKSNAIFKGLEFRLKEKHSLIRKITTAVLNEKAKLITNRNIQDLKISSVAELSAEITDSLRYTLLFPFETYTNSVEETIKVLEEAGIHVHNCKNFWKGGDQYQGINCVMSTKSKDENFLVEIQFHTQESFDSKMRSHEQYEKFRVETDPEKKMEMFKIGVEMANEVDVPSEVLRIPKVTGYPQPNTFALWSFKILEKATKYEPKITSDLQTLFDLKGLGNRIKEDASIQRSLEYKRNTLCEKQGNYKITVSSVVPLITDSVRYTVVFNDDEYTQSIMDSIEKVKNLGYELTQVVNHWLIDVDSNQCVIAKFSGKEEDHPIFEIEFHTPLSYTTKEHSIDEIFDQVRSESDPEKVKIAQEKIFSIWNSVPNPRNVDEISNFSK